MKHRAATLLFASCLSGCTFTAPVAVRPVSTDMIIDDVCIEQNPKKSDEEFLSVVRTGFQRHGITTRIVREPTADGCDFVLTYKALYMWDFTSYLFHAELMLEKKGEVIGFAEYHIKGGGGTTLKKYDSTKTKLDPLIDELLANVTQE